MLFPTPQNTFFAICCWQIAALVLLSALASLLSRHSTKHYLPTFKWVHDALSSPHTIFSERPTLSTNPQRGPFHISKSQRGRSRAPAELHAPWQTVQPTMYSGSPGTKTIHSSAQPISVPQRCRTRSALATVPRCVAAQPSFTMAQVAERVIYAPSQPYNFCAERPAVFKFTSVESTARSVRRCTLRTERRTVNQSSKLANG